MKAHHLYSTATTLAAAVLLAAPSLADQTISDAQTKAVNMTEGKLTVTGTGFLNVAKNAVNLKDPIQSALEIEVMEGGRISGKSALVLDQDMENGITGQLISVTNSGTMTGTEKQAIDLRYMINTSATITNNGTISAGQKGAVKLGNNATVVNNGTIETTAAGENGITAKHYDPEDDGIDTFAHGLDLANNSGGKITGMKHGVTGEGKAAISNNGRIEGRGGSGLNWDWNAALQQDDKYVVTVVNGKDGVISGTGDATTLDGDGVDVDYIVNLTNSGTIIAKDSFGSADGLAIGGGVVTNTGTITASNSNTNGQAYGILVDDSDGGNAFEAIRITNSGTIEGTGSNGVGIRIVSDRENCIFMEGRNHYRRQRPGGGHGFRRRCIFLFRRNSERQRGRRSGLQHHGLPTGGDGPHVFKRFEKLPFHQHPGLIPFPGRFRHPGKPDHYPGYGLPEPGQAPVQPGGEFHSLRLSFIQQCNPSIDGNSGRSSGGWVRHGLLQTGRERHQPGRAGSTDGRRV